jgi:hypothetical protein
LDTFVAAQIRSELAASELDPRLYHLREEHGRREVDLLIETAAGALIGIEVKASATVATSDARHLAWLRDEVGDAFLAGLVVHTGPHVFPLGDRLIAAPARWGRTSILSGCLRCGPVPGQRVQPPDIVAGVEPPVLGQGAMNIFDCQGGDHVHDVVPAVVLSAASHDAPENSQRQYMYCSSAKPNQDGISSLSVTRKSAGCQLIRPVCWFCQ